MASDGAGPTTVRQLSGSHLKKQTFAVRCFGFRYSGGTKERPDSRYLTTLWDNGPVIFRNVQTQEALDGDAVQRRHTRQACGAEFL